MLEIKFTLDPADKMTASILTALASAVGGAVPAKAEVATVPTQEVEIPAPVAVVEVAEEVVEEQVPVKKPRKTRKAANPVEPRLEEDPVKVEPSAPAKDPVKVEPTTVSATVEPVTPEASEERLAVRLINAVERKPELLDTIQEWAKKHGLELSQVDQATPEQAAEILTAINGGEAA